MQGWTAKTRYGVTRKRSTKRLKHTENLFRKHHIPAWFFNKTSFAIGLIAPGCWWYTHNVIIIIRIICFTFFSAFNSPYCLNAWLYLLGYQPLHHNPHKWLCCLSSCAGTGPLPRVSFCRIQCSIVVSKYFYCQLQYNSHSSLLCLPVD